MRKLTLNKWEEPYTLNMAQDMLNTIEIVGSHVVPEFGTIASDDYTCSSNSKHHCFELTAKTRTSLIPKF